MLPTLLLPDATCLNLLHIKIAPTTMTLTAMPSTPDAACPRCATRSSRVHSRYERHIADLPVAGRAMYLCLQVRKFFCRTTTCPQAIFAERLPDIVPLSARRSTRLLHDQRQLGLDYGGEAGARTADQLGMPTSPDTILRLVRRAPLPPSAAPRVLGVDDFAFRKGRTYGTLLVDLERQQPIDLLPDRTADTLAAWLAANPGVEIISRDRGGAYAEGAARGAPHAVQVADRFHLLQNLRETLQRLLDRHQAALQAASAPLASPPTLDVDAGGSTAGETASAAPTSEPHMFPPPTRVEQEQQVRRQRREARYTTVIDLHQQGLGIRAIARQLRISRDTVKRFLTAGSFPERADPKPRASILDPFMSYLTERSATGCTNGTQLWREIAGQGYRGSRALVARWVAQQRSVPSSPALGHAPRKQRGRPPAPPRPPRAIRPIAARRAAWLLVRRPEDLTDGDRALLDRLLQACPDAVLAYPFAQRFLTMVRLREESGLTAWLTEAAASAIPELQAFVSGVRRDECAVRAALSSPWSQGQVEGQVNRLKLIKRSMYGRANFDLLRKRVLAA